MLSAELKAFYRVAQLGSITQAAKKLGLSQPTVTTQIRNLESQYAVELFYRGGRRLTLSDEGVRLLPMVKALLQQEADIEFFLRNSGQGNGTLRIAATAPYYILDLVKAFRERLPQIEVAVDIGNSQPLLKAQARRLGGHTIDQKLGAQRRIVHARQYRAVFSEQFRQAPQNALVILGQQKTTLLERRRVDDDHIVRPQAFDLTPRLEQFMPKEAHFAGVMPV